MNNTADSYHALTLDGWQAQMLAVWERVFDCDPVEGCYCYDDDRCTVPVRLMVTSH